MISELIQVGTQKGIFNIEGLSDTLAIKKKARQKPPKNLTIKVHAASASARKKVEEAGGSVESA